MWATHYDDLRWGPRRMLVNPMQASSSEPAFFLRVFARFSFFTTWVQKSPMWATHHDDLHWGPRRMLVNPMQASTSESAVFCTFLHVSVLCFSHLRGAARLGKKGQAPRVSESHYLPAGPSD